MNDYSGVFMAALYVVAATAATLSLLRLLLNLRRSQLSVARNWLPELAVFIISLVVLIQFHSVELILLPRWGVLGAIYHYGDLRSGEHRWNVVETFPLESVVTEKYLHETLGSPPYWPKWRERYKDKGMYCIHEGKVKTGLFARTATFNGDAHYNPGGMRLPYHARAVRTGLCSWKIDEWHEEPPP